MENMLQKAALKILTVVNRDKDHIPPITTSESNPFPYRIVLNPRSDSWQNRIGIGLYWFLIWLIAGSGYAREWFSEWNILHTYIHTYMLLLLLLLLPLPHGYPVLGLPCVSVCFMLTYMSAVITSGCDTLFFFFSSSSSSCLFGLLSTIDSCGVFAGWCFLVLVYSKTIISGQVYHRKSHS